MNQEALKNYYTKAGLTRYEQTIGKYLRHAIIIKAERCDNIPVGTSKFGGNPDLPPDWQWPTIKRSGQEWPLDFIAQINFAETKPYDVENELPDHGMLYLFYDLDEQPWGNVPEDRDSFHVAYYNDDIMLLQPSPTPENCSEKFALASARLNFSSRIELPDPDSLLISLSGMNKEECELYENAYYESLPDDDEDDGLSHKLLGHSENIQDEMELECQLVTHGIHYGDAESYQEPCRAELEAGAADWVLLLQIDSDEENCDMMWGDCGRIYLWIRREDLQARRFEHSHLILQCC